MLLLPQTVIFEDLVMAKHGQEFKALVLLKRLSSIVWPEEFTHLRVSARLDGEINLYSKFTCRQDIAANEADGADDEVQVILDGFDGAWYLEVKAPQALDQRKNHSPAYRLNVLDQPTRHGQN